MSPPSVARVREAAANIVHDAHARGNLSNLTIRIVRGLVEEKLGLEAGALDAKEHRNVVKQATLDAKADLPSSSRKKSSNTLLDEAATDSSTDTKSLQVSKPKSSNKRQRQEKTSKTFKSAEMISTSGEDEEPTATKSQFKQRHAGSDEADNSDDGKMKSSSAHGRTSTPDGGVSDDGFGSDIVPPQPKRSKKETKKVDKTSDKGKKPSRAEKEPLSKEEATTKRLKSFVLACGVRKVWGVYFKDTPEPSQQIRKLRDLLHDLGMKERFTMEQAKRIKQKRELAQELADVQSFERSMKERGNRRSRRGSALETDTDDEIGDIQEEVKSRRKTALQSIAAFLDSQSEDDD